MFQEILTFKKIKINKLMAVHYIETKEIIVKK